MKHFPMITIDLGCWSKLSQLECLRSFTEVLQARCKIGAPYELNVKRLRKRFVSYSSSLSSFAKSRRLRKTNFGWNRLE